jgi:hypothetical protein
MKRLSQLSDTQNSINEQMIREMGSVRQELQEMKELLSRIQVQPQRRRRGLLFGARRRGGQVQMEPEKTKPALPLEDLLPLLPQLGSVIPQLSSPKIAESLKILANPAVLGMIQQFLANGGLKGKSITQVGSGGRRLLR